PLAHTASPRRFFADSATSRMARAKLRLGRLLGLAGVLGLAGLRSAPRSFAQTSAASVARGAGRGTEWGRSATEEELSKEVPTLYVYDHCPFCVRARMIFGLKRMPYKLGFLMNDDVVTPTKMIGKKVLPILEMDGEAMGESLDIVAKIDQLGTPILQEPADRTDIDQWMKENKELLRRLTRPRDASALYPEFATRAARATWVKNHPVEEGIEKALGRSEELLAELNGKLKALDKMIHSEMCVNEGGLSYDDITLFPTLRRLTIVKGLEWPKKLRSYVDYMADVCDIPLLDGMAM
ncbi:unnamed protein product, partial [Effrenium voratum]